MEKVRIREIYKRVRNTNPLAGAAYDEVGEPIAFEIVGPTGVCARCKTETKAETERAAWAAYFDKFFPINEGVVK